MLNSQTIPQTDDEVFLARMQAEIDKLISIVKKAQVDFDNSPQDRQKKNYLEKYKDILHERSELLDDVKKMPVERLHYIAYLENSLELLKNAAADAAVDSDLDPQNIALKEKYETVNANLADIEEKWNFFVNLYRLRRLLIEKKVECNASPNDQDLKGDYLKLLESVREKNKQLDESVAEFNRLVAHENAPSSLKPVSSTEKLKSESTISVTSSQLVSVTSVTTLPQASVSPRVRPKPPAKKPDEASGPSASSSQQTATSFVVKVQQTTNSPEKKADETSGPSASSSQQTATVHSGTASGASSARLFNPSPEVTTTRRARLRKKLAVHSKDGPQLFPNILPDLRGKIGEVIEETFLGHY